MSTKQRFSSLVRRLKKLQLQSFAASTTTVQPDSTSRPCWQCMHKRPLMQYDEPTGRVGRGSGRGGPQDSTETATAIALPARSSRPSRREGEERCVDTNARRVSEDGCVDTMATGWTQRGNGCVLCQRIVIWIAFSSVTIKVRFQETQNEVGVQLGIKPAQIYVCGAIN